MQTLPARCISLNILINDCDHVVATYHEFNIPVYWTLIVQHKLCTSSITKFFFTISPASKKIFYSSSLEYQASHETIMRVTSLVGNGPDG
jgi:hypothetical protein